MINRFSVSPLSNCTRKLANVASGRKIPDLILSNARILSTYTDRILEDKEIWISEGRIACVRENNESLNIFNKSDLKIYDVQKNILAPGLIDPHMHIESSMMTACAYAEPALLNGTTTIFCDSHEIGNVSDVEGIEAGFYHSYGPEWTKDNNNLSIHERPSFIDLFCQRSPASVTKNRSYFRFIPVGCLKEFVGLP